jgi:hypothetical protein
MALDLNEENITGVSTNPHIVRVDTKDLKTVLGLLEELNAE